ncbi:Uncharacterised protein [Vibrio cholerae]|nr:Uncharacterised protein [Vibrio cholerae]
MRLYQETILRSNRVQRIKRIIQHNIKHWTQPPRIYWHNAA